MVGVGPQGKRIKIWPTVFPGPGATWAPKESADGARIAFSKMLPDARIGAGFFNAFTLGVEPGLHHRMQIHGNY